MKTKLTVTIDRDLLPQAKRYARAHGVSLSATWQGMFTARDSSDDRYRAFGKEYW